MIQEDIVNASSIAQMYLSNNHMPSNELDGKQCFLFKEVKTLKREVIYFKPSFTSKEF